MIPEINANADVKPITDYERSCNCCNDNKCVSDCCCFPWMRRRHAADCPASQKTSRVSKAVLVDGTQQASHRHKSSHNQHPKK